MSALHSRHILPREAQKSRIHTRFAAYLTGDGGVLIWGSLIRPISAQTAHPEPRMDNTMPILLVPGLVSSPRISAP